VKDVAVVSACIAGLTAAWLLRDLDAHEPGGSVGGTVFFAGDYVGEWTHMESAARTATEAAAAVRARLAALAPA
jgi:predicted NAD/FAD-binding protein